MPTLKGATEFYQEHLNRVSRSFAACIARLETPLRSWVSLTYLLCRILDTVEDATWSERRSQFHSFEVFRKLVEHKISPEVQSKELDGWMQSFPATIPEGERLLLNDTGRILHDLHCAPEEIRSPILALVGAMSEGMRHFCARSNDGRVRLIGLAEVNQYCFFVAGLVGETLSKLLRAVGSQMELRRDLVVDSHHFGLFLQKVNLLKDQVRDEAEGRFLVPSRSELFASLGRNAVGAMRYIEAIPLERKDYRVFCSWSLFLGLATLPLLSKADNSKPPHKSAELVDKLPRNLTLDLFAQIEIWVDSPDILRTQFNYFLSAAGLPVSEHSSTMEHSTDVSRSHQPATNWAWIAEVYKGLLSPDDLCALGLADC